MDSCDFDNLHHRPIFFENFVTTVYIQHALEYIF